VLDAERTPDVGTVLTSSTALMAGIPLVALGFSCFTDDRPVREDSR
jgi:hypothetical protein